MESRDYEHLIVSCWNQETMRVTLIVSCWNLLTVSVRRGIHLQPRDYQGKRVNPPYRSSKVIPLKLFLDIVPSSSLDITRASFRFVSKQNLQRCENVFFDVLITSKGASVLSVCLNAFRNFNRSLNKRRMFPAMTITE